MMNIVKLDPEADLFFDVGITIPTSKLHWARNTHGFKHENVIPLIRCTEPKSPGGSISNEIGRSAAVKNFPLYWIAQAELSCHVPTFGTWSLYLDVSTSEHDPLAYLHKIKAYISTQHELKLNSNTSFASNELTCKGAKSRKFILKKHIESLEKFDPQVRFEGTFKLPPMQWEEGHDMPNRWDYFDAFVWEPLMLWRRTPTKSTAS